MRPYTDRVSWWVYVQRVSGGQNPAQIAAKMGGGIATSTVNRWKTADPSPETIFAFADAYSRSRQEALLAAYLPGEDADAEALLSAVSNKTLLAEVARRMRN